MIKISAIFACLALATAASVGGNQPGQISVQLALQEIQNQPHIAIPNQQQVPVVGYYITVPYDVLATLSSLADSEAHQYIQQLQQQGYLPIYNNGGILLGFYTQMGGTGAPTQNINYYMQNLYRYGLIPIANQQSQVVGLYYSPPMYGSGMAGMLGGMGAQGYNLPYQHSTYGHGMAGMGMGGMGMGGMGMGGMGMGGMGKGGMGMYAQYYQGYLPQQHQWYPSQGHGNAGVNRGTYAQY